MAEGQSARAEAGPRALWARCHWGRVAALCRGAAIAPLFFVACGAEHHELFEPPVSRAACVPSPAPCERADEPAVAALVGVWRPTRSWGEDERQLFAATHTEVPDDGRPFEDAAASFYFDGCFVHRVVVTSWTLDAPVEDGCDASALREGSSVARLPATIDGGGHVHAWLCAHEIDLALRDRAWRRIDSAEATAFERRLAASCDDESMMLGVPPSLVAPADEALCAQAAAAGLDASSVDPIAWRTWQALWITSPREAARWMAEMAASGLGVDAIVGNAESASEVAEIRARLDASAAVRSARVNGEHAWRTTRPIETRGPRCGE